jgi:peptidase E
VKAAGPLRAPEPQIVAFGGGGFSMEAGNPLLDEYVLELARARRERPRVCFLPSASGDADHYIVRFYKAFPAAVCEPSHLSLFRRDEGVAGDLRDHLLAQDLIYVGGGSVVSLLGVWAAHGLDRVLEECWRAGVVLCGLSAGSLCWFSQGISAFHGAPCAVRGLGFLPFSNTVHYGGDESRRAGYHRHLRNGMAAGFAVEDGAALHFTGRELARVVSSRPGARAHWVQEGADGIEETPLPSRYLGAPPAAAGHVAA